MPFVDAATKCAVEKKRRETINSKIVEIKKIIFPATALQQDVPHHKILAKAAELLTGAYPTAPTPSSSSTGSAGSSRSSTPAGPGPVKKDRKEYKKDLEAVRRSKEAVAFNALYTYVTRKNLGPRGKVEKSKLLDIVIQELQKQGNAAAAPVPAPVVQSPSFSMQRFLTAPVAPAVPPPLPAPLPVAQVNQGTLQFFQYLAFYQQFSLFFPMISIAQNIPIVEEEEDEIIDVVNV